MSDQEYIDRLIKLAEDMRKTAARFEEQAARMGQFVAVQLQRLEEGQGNDG
jgi:hypothetical protein